MTHSRKKTFKGKLSEVVTLLKEAMNTTSTARFYFASRHLVSRHPFFIFLSRADKRSARTYLFSQILSASQKDSRAAVTRTLKGNEKPFELAGFRVIGVD